MSDDIIKRLREAIAARPTPGPWGIGTPPPNGEQTIGTRQGLALAVATTGIGMEAETLANATYIAAASPDNIAALLDRLDAAERENERLRSAINWACGYDEGPPHLGLQPEQKGAFAWRHELRRRAGMPWKEIDAAMAAERGKE